MLQLTTDSGHPWKFFVQESNDLPLLENMVGVDSRKHVKMVIQKGPCIVLVGKGIGRVLGRDPKRYGDSVGSQRLQHYNGKLMTNKLLLCQCRWYIKKYSIDCRQLIISFAVAEL